MKNDDKLNDVPRYNDLPEGWKKISGATTAPRGWYWAYNGKGFFSGERKHALIREKKTYIQAELFGSVEE